MSPDIAKWKRISPQCTSSFFSIKLKTNTLNGTGQIDQLYFASKDFRELFSQRLGILKAEKKGDKSPACFVEGGAGRLGSNSFVRCEMREQPRAICHLLFWDSKTTGGHAKR